MQLILILADMPIPYITTPGSFAWLTTSQILRCQGLQQRKNYSQAAKHGDKRTSINSTFMKVKGSRYLWDKEAGWSEVWGKMTEDKKKVK